jgi:hypothetical protein
MYSDPFVPQIFKKQKTSFLGATQSNSQLSTTFQNKSFINKENAL